MGLKDLQRLVKLFHGRFSGLDTAYGLFTPKEKQKPGAKKVAGSGTTYRGEVDETLWKMHLRGEAQLGIVPIKLDGTCVWGALDIDVYDLDHAALEKKIAENVLPLTVCTTKSGGAHLYLFLSEPIPARLVRQKLGDWAVALGYPGVEIYPKQDELAGPDDVGNWLNMPYVGSMGPEKTTRRYAIYDGQALSAQEFMELAAARTVDQETLEQVHPVGGPIGDGPPCLQTMALHGVPEGGRNETLFSYGIYAKLKYGDAWEDKVSEYNHDYMVPPLPYQEVANIVKSLKRKEYNYACSKQPLKGYCNKEICRQRPFGISTSSGSDDPGVMIDALTQVTSDPPLWYATVNGVRIRLTTDDLLNQTRFAKKCVEELRFIPNKIKPFKWNDLVNRLLREAEVVQAPEDSGPRGKFLALLEDFCTNEWQARDWEEILRGKPYTHDDGYTYFRSTDLVKYLQQQHFREMRDNEIWACLRELGANHKQKKVKGRCVQLWFVPAFEAQDEEFTVPRTEQSEF